MHRRQLWAVAALADALSSSAFSQGKPIKIAHIFSKTGPLEAYGKQTAVGFMMGLDYATGGTMLVAGRKLEVIERDDQGKPDLGKSLLAAGVRRVEGRFDTGDAVMIADEDGAVVIPRHLAAEVARDAAEQERVERFVRRRVDRGASIVGLYPPNEAAMAAYRLWVDAGESDAAL